MCKGERAKNEIKQLENRVDRLGKRNSKLETKIERLEKENEKLKQELKSHNKPSKWAKANKNKNPDGSLLKKRVLKKVIKPPLGISLKMLIKKPPGLRFLAVIVIINFQSLTNGINRKTLYSEQVKLSTLKKLKKGIMQVVIGTDLVVELFDNNIEEAVNWFQIPNTFLFGESPFEVCIRGEGKFLINWLMGRLGKDEAIES